MNGSEQRRGIQSANGFDSEAIQITSFFLEQNDDEDYGRLRVRHETMSRRASQVRIKGSNPFDELPLINSPRAACFAE